MIKLNRDGTALHRQGIGGYGGVFRNHRGEWVTGYYNALALTTPVEAELKAIKYGLQIAIQQGYSMLEIESDALEALECILTGIPVYDDLVFDCRYLLRKLAVWVLRHVFREQNQLHG